MTFVKNYSWTSDFVEILFQIKYGFVKIAATLKKKSIVSDTKLAYPHYRLLIVTLSKWNLRQRLK